MKVLKWYLLLKIWATSKRKMLFLLVLWVTVFVIMQVMGDLISISQHETIVGFIYAKWLFLSVVIGASWIIVYRIYLDTLSAISFPVKSQLPETKEAVMKQKMLSKESLKSRSDAIIEKYQ